MMEELPFLKELAGLELPRPSELKSRVAQYAHYPDDRQVFPPASLHIAEKMGLKLGETYNQLSWFERKEVPEGLTFPSPPPVAWEAMHDGRAAIRTASPLSLTEAQDVYLSAFDAHYQASEKDTDRNETRELARLQAACTAIEEVIDWHEQAVDQVHNGIRRVLSAWVFAVAHLSDGEWPSNADLLADQWSDHFKRIGTKLIEIESESELGFNDENRLRSARNHDPVALPLGYAHLLWEMTTHPKRSFDEPAHLRFIMEQATAHLPVPPTLTQTSYAALLYYAGRAVQPVNKLSRLHFKRLAYQRIRRAIATGQRLPRRNEIRRELVEARLRDTTKAERKLWSAKQSLARTILTLPEEGDREFSSKDPDWPALLELDPAWSDKSDEQLFERATKYDWFDRKGTAISKHLRDHFEFPDGRLGQKWEARAREWTVELALRPFHFRDDEGQT